LPWLITFKRFFPDLASLGRKDFVERKDFPEQPAKFLANFFTARPKASREKEAV
jgi:hypothetical protein